MAAVRDVIAFFSGRVISSVILRCRHMDGIKNVMQRDGVDVFRQVRIYDELQRHRALFIRRKFLRVKQKHSIFWKCSDAVTGATLGTACATFFPR